MPWNKHESFGQYLSARYPDIWNKSIVTSLPLPNYDILELQRKVRFGLIPSTWDMFNFSCIELLAAGTPVICSDGAGASELIEHGKNGFKYSAMDIVALSDCIRRVQLLNETEYNKLAFAAIETVKDHLSPARLLPKNIGEYQNVLMNFKSSSANSFLEKIYAPSDQEHSIGEILDTFPLKPLLAYVANRLGSKIARNKNT